MSIFLKLKKIVSNLISCLLILSVIVNITPLVNANFDDLDSLFYQISVDGSIWWYTENEKWLLADTENDTSTLSEIKENISTFTQTGQILYLKTINTKGKEDPKNTKITKNNKPIVSIKQNPSQINDGSGYVSIQLALKDVDKDNTSLRLEYSYDNGTNWHAASISLAFHENGDVYIDSGSKYQIGKNTSLPTSLGDVELFITWDSKLDLANQEKNIILRVTPFDSLEEGEKIKTENFNIDNKAPDGLQNLYIEEMNQDSALVSWDKLNETKNIASYNLFYGETKTSIRNKTSSKLKLNLDQTKAKLSGLKNDTLYYFLVSAVDQQGNETNSPILSSITFPSTTSTEANNTNTNTKTEPIPTETTDTKTESTATETTNAQSQPSKTTESKDSTQQQTKTNNDKNTNNNSSNTNPQKNNSGINASTQTNYDNYQKNDELVKNISITKCQNENFTDINSSHWAYIFVNALHNLCINNIAIIEGYEDKTFKPDQSITRFEFLKLVLYINEINIDEEINFEKNFNDVTKTNDLVSKVIYKALEIGVIEGYSDGNFYPNKEINRAEAAKIVLKASNLGTDNLQNANFNDAPWYVPYVYEILSQGIMSGYEDGSFGVDQPLLRSEAAKIMYNTMIKKGLIDE